MAVTIQDLLGTQDYDVQNRIDRFPSYDSFAATRGRSPRAQYDSAPAAAPAPSRASEPRRYFDRNEYRVQDAPVRYSAPAPETERRDYYGYGNDYGYDYQKENAYGYDGYNQYPEKSYREEEAYQAGYANVGYAKKQSAEKYSNNRYSFGDEYGRDYDINQRLYAQRQELEQNEEYKNELLGRLAFSSPMAREDAKASYYVVPKKAVKKKNIKGRVILAIYIALVVVVATLIIVNAAGVGAPADAKGAVTLNASDLDTVVGYVDSGYRYVVNTNWFDRICDAISGGLYT